MADSDTESERLGARPDGEESELERVGRIALATWIDDHTSALYHEGRRIVTETYSGDTLDADDIQALRTEIEQLQWVLDEYADPVADRQQDADD